MFSFMIRKKIFLVKKFRIYRLPPSFIIRNIFILNVQKISDVRTIKRITSNFRKVIGSQLGLDEV